MYPSVKLVPSGKAIGLDELGLSWQAVTQVSWQAVTQVPCSECGSTVPHACPGRPRPEDATDYRLRLARLGPNKIQVVKILRDQFGVNLAIAVQWANNIPADLSPVLSKELAEEIRDALTHVGATVEMTPDWTTR